MICLVMQGTNPFLITCLYNICFYNIGFIESNNGPFKIQEMQLLGKARLLIMWTSQESSWTLGFLGDLDSLGPLDPLGELLDS